MKALYFSQHGSTANLEYGELPDPELESSGNLLIRVKACALNHLDLWVLAGWKGLELPFPHYGGADVAGIVEDPGESQGFKQGDRVVVCPGYIDGPEDEWSLSGQDSLSPSYKILGEGRTGGFAELLCVPAHAVHKIPDNRSYEEAAAPLLVGLTAWRMLITQSSIKKDDTVLVVGSGGGLNSFTVQLAKSLGAQVIALTSTEAKEEKSLKLGADIAINYLQKPDWPKDILRVTEGLGADIVVDNVGAASFPNSLKAVKKGGTIVTVGNTSGPNLQIDNRYIFSKQIKIVGSTMGSAADFDSLLEHLWTNKLKPVIHQSIPLEAGQEGYKILEEGKQFGKVVVTV